MQLDRHMRIEAPDRGRGAVDLGQTDLRRAVDHLPLQVGQRDRVVVDDRQRADPGGGEIQQRGRAEPAGADDQHPRALERGLSGSADLVQHDVAGIAFELLRAQHRCMRSIVDDPSAASSAKAQLLQRPQRPTPWMFETAPMG